MDETQESETTRIEENESFSKVPDGPYFTFSIPGLKKVAEEIAQRNDARSLEERMAFLVGPKAEAAEKARIEELHRRLNREEVKYRTKLLNVAKKRKIYGHVNAQQQQQPHSSNSNGAKQEWLPPEKKPNVTNGGGFSNLQNAPGHSGGPSIKEPEIAWKLIPVDCVECPFSWRHIVEQWRDSTANQGSVDMQLGQDQNFELEEGEIIEQQDNFDIYYGQANMEMQMYNGQQQRLEEQNIKEESFDISQNPANMGMDEQQETTTENEQAAAECSTSSTENYPIEESKIVVDSPVNPIVFARPTTPPRPRSWRKSGRKSKLMKRKEVISGESIELITLDDED